jgi:hypothetical protein
MSSCFVETIRLTSQIITRGSRSSDCRDRGRENCHSSSADNAATSLQRDRQWTRRLVGEFVSWRRGGDELDTMSRRLRF